jgi:hypothetical protein
MTAKVSEWDKENLDKIIRDGHGDWFSAHLLRLMAKSDMQNRALLGSVYPEHLAALERYWNNGLKA